MTVCGGGFYSNRGIKETKGGEGKNWHPLCTHPSLPSGKLILSSKGASRRSTAFNAFDSIYFTIDDFRISSLWASYELDSFDPSMAWLETREWIRPFKIVIKLPIVIKLRIII